MPFRDRGKAGRRLAERLAAMELDSPVVRALPRGGVPVAFEIAVPGGLLHGDLVLAPARAPIVVFAHGSGSSRHSPRNRQVAEVLRQAGLGTLLLDLLTDTEEGVDIRTAEHRFDTGLLADRLMCAVEWLDGQDLGEPPIGYFGASTGAAAALLAAAWQQDRIGAVVSRGGRPDLAGDALPEVRAPTLLIVGGRDEVVLDLNRRAASHMSAEHRLVVVAGATHLFEEPGALDKVASLAAEWFTSHLAGVPLPGEQVDERAGPLT